MKEIKKGSLIEFLSIIPDPRIEKSRRHNLLDILVIAVCTVICEAEIWTDIEDFGYQNRTGLSPF